MLHVDQHPVEAGCGDGDGGEVGLSINHVPIAGVPARNSSLGRFVRTPPRFSASG